MAGLYLALEDAFRGSPEDIAERVSEYLPILEQGGLNPETDLVVDIGCGRGEWLRVLSQKGYRNKGCDLNEVMVATCLEQGLDAVQQDALQFLGSLPDNSVAVVTAFHVIEHLPLSSVLALIDASLRVLRPGGLLILETPNPQNILVASHNFYIDPTHRKPVPMILLQFLVEERGFCDIRPLSLHPYAEAALVESSSEVARRFNEYFYGSQDYAIIAVKP
jgi:SAM-dependent methyltransferase